MFGLMKLFKNKKTLMYIGLAIGGYLLYNKYLKKPAQSEEPIEPVAPVDNPASLVNSRGANESVFAQYSIR